MTRKAQIIVFALTMVGASLLAGCGRSITVEFRNAEGLKGGEPVYLAGVKIGSTSDGPSLVNGCARVPVLIGHKHKYGVPAGTVFLLSPDPDTPGRQCLIAYSFGFGTRPTEGSNTEGSNEVYRGASSRAELILIVGSDKAGRVWRELTR